MQSSHRQSTQKAAAEQQAHCSKDLASMTCLTGALCREYGNILHHKEYMGITFLSSLLRAGKEKLAPRICFGFMPERL